MPAKRKNKQASEKAPLHRTGATERHYVPSYPKKLYIYKLKASKFWWARYFANGNAVRKSTKTENKRLAIEFAKQFYDEITMGARAGRGAALAATSFDVCLKQMLEADKAAFDRGDITKITYDNNKYRYDKSIRPFFTGMDVREIDYYQIDRYLNEISQQALSSSTISSYLRLVRRVLVYAARRRLITAVPEIPAVRVKDKPRGWFNTSEYRKLWSAAQRLAGRVIEVRKYYDAEGEKHTQYIDKDSDAPKLGKLLRSVRMTEDLRRLIVFMVNSYIRPSDIKTMQHKHIEVAQRDGHVFLRLTIPPSKGHSNPIVTMHKAVETYQALREYHKREGLIGDNPSDEYVFLPQYVDNRDYALKQLQRQWDVLMAETGLSSGVAGEERTIYSLRHTAIMYRLLYGDGINTLLLARNARTSVDMIDRFYAKPLTGEMNIAMLQSTRRKRKIYDGDDVLSAQAGAQG